MEQIEKAWQCIEGCNVFWAVGRPTTCPYCGDNEVYPVNADRSNYLIVENASR